MCELILKGQVGLEQGDQKMLINLTLSLSALYLITFTYLPNSIRLPIAGLIAVAFIALSLLGIMRADHGAERGMFIGILLIISAWLVSFLFDPDAPMRDHVTFAKGFRSSVPLFAGVAILAFRNQISPRLISILVSAIILVAAFVAATNPINPYAGIDRLQAFSGNDGLHTSAYSVALCAIIIFELLKIHAINRYYGYFLLGISLVLFVGLLEK